MNKEYTATEWCPHCESEIEMTWNVEDRGYKAFCPVCGRGPTPAGFRSGQIRFGPAAGNSGKECASRSVLAGGF